MHPPMHETHAHAGIFGGVKGHVEGDITRARCWCQPRPGYAGANSRTCIRKPVSAAWWCPGDIGVLCVWGRLDRTGLHPMGLAWACPCSLMGCPRSLGCAEPELESEFSTEECCSVVPRPAQKFSSRPHFV
eukprot:359892-Chlamydomonas_euryale.AAC.1